MSSFLIAAYKVLSKTEHPLSTKEIVEIAIKNNILQPNGKTPVQTMNSKLSMDILYKQAKSLFMRTDVGKFGLRRWRRKYSEYIARRYKKSLINEDVMVFPITSLFNYISKTGLNTKNFNIGSLLFGCYPIGRYLAEEDPSLVQLVSFYVVRYADKYLTYKRAKRVTETRLHGCYSIGFGGHLNYKDIPFLLAIGDPEQALLYMTRELEEELIIEPPINMTFRGLLYDDSRDVSKQHLGLVYDVFLNSPHYEIGERGLLTNAKFETLDDILNRASDFENWSLLIAKEALR
jgi:predicted NUDIX family phosphoesterase